MKLVETVVSFCVMLLFEFPIDLFCNIGTVAASATSSTSGVGFISTINTSLSNGVASFLPSLQSLGYALVITFFVIQMIELVISERCTLELLIKSFAKVGVGLGLVGYSEKIYKGLISFADAFTSFVNTNANFKITATLNTTNLAANISGVLTKVCEENEIAWIPLLGIAIVIGPILAILGVILTAIVYVICITRIFELSLRGCFLPIGFALMADDGWRGAGGRYVRKFLAVAAQGAAICLIGKITTGCIGLSFNHLAQSLITSVNPNVNMLPGDLLVAILSSMTVMIGTSVAAIAAMFKSQSVINDVFGA